MALNDARMTCVSQSMSITRLLKGPYRTEARKILDDFAPEPITLPRASSALIVPPVSNRSDLVGTAFDYAARMELQHLAPHAVARQWIAERALTRLAKDRVAGKRAQRVVSSARDALRSGLPRDTRLRHATIANHATQLAQIDPLFRARRPPTFGARDGIDESSIEAEVEQLLKIADPLWALASERPLLLNPQFGVLSDAIGGADADLIAGSAVIEIKVVRDRHVARDAVRALSCYGLMAVATGMAALESLNIYHARLGRMLSMNFPLDLDASECERALTALFELWARSFPRQ